MADDVEYKAESKLQPQFQQQDFQENLKKLDELIMEDPEITKSTFRSENLSNFNSKNSLQTNHDENIKRYPDGSWYEGLLVQDKKQGIGVMHYADGSIFKGAFQDDKRNGSGVLVKPNGDRYNGAWKNDLRDGKGIESTAGAQYEGRFYKDLRSGYGR